MFKKIVSKLPYNPSLIHQLSFYAKRLHQEETIRRTGAAFTILALGVQGLAIISPAQISLATSSNDIVYGATTKQQIIEALTSGTDSKGRSDIKQIHDYYGIRLADVQATTDVTVKSRERSYITTGRSDSPGVDTPIQIPGTSTTIYERSLNVWDQDNYENTYPAITGTATGEGVLKGRRFWILLKGCGNITFEPLPKNPKLEIAKTRSGSENLKTGDEFTYRIDFRNSGNAPAKNVVISDTLPTNLDFVSQTSSLPATFSANGKTLRWQFGDLQPGQNWHYISLKVKVVGTFASDTEFCNIASVSATDTESAQSENCGVQETDKYSRITLAKKVSNLTQKIDDANNTVAKAGDVLEYSLLISNSGNIEAKNYVIDSDVLNDILAYADLVSYDGASFDRIHNRLTWPAATIQPNQTLTKKFTVKVKSPIPSTPASLSDPNLYDYSMINTFGNQVIVKIDKPVTAITYQTATSIPNTGPGSSILISLLAAMVIGYFYARSRLLAHEVDIIKSEQVAGV